MYPIVQQDITLDELISSDEVFITSTIKKVMPVVKIDDTLINGGTVGPIATQLYQWMTTHTSC